MPKSKKPTPPKSTWRRNPDDIIFRLTPISTGSNESCCPTPSTIERAVAGDPQARSIIDSYVCRLPVRLVEVLPCV